MRNPKVSVLIPCYNAEKYLGETLESVFSQTWPNLEVIVVDDGSTDKSGDVLRSFKRANLIAIRQSNRGQTAALNVCVGLATGDFVQYLDADDLISLEKISIQIDRLLEAPDCIATAEWGRFYRSPSETKFNSYSEWRDLDPLDWLAQGMRMMFPALWLIPIGIVRRAGPWDETLSLANDAEYFTRVLLNAEKVLFCKGARCYYRSGVRTSLSGAKTRSAWRSQERVIELCEARVRAREDSERIRQLFAIQWQLHAHAVYPYFPKLANQALQRARALHPIQIRPGGGLTFSLVSHALGWKIARRLQVERSVMCSRAAPVEPTE